MLMQRQGFEYLDEVHKRRQGEVEEAKDGIRDASEANVSQIDLGIAKGYASQHNIMAMAYNEAEVWQCWAAECAD